MDYEKAMSLYMKCRREMELIEAEAATKVSPLKEKMGLLLQWMETKANMDGLKNVPVEGVGTGYWTNSTSATVADPSVFWGFVKENQLFDLVETRASSKAVKSYIDAYDAPPPGVNFSQVRVFKVRAATSGKEEG